MQFDIFIAVEAVDDRFEGEVEGVAGGEFLFPVGFTEGDGAVGGLLVGRNVGVRGRLGSEKLKMVV